MYHLEPPMLRSFLLKLLLEDTMLIVHSLPMATMFTAATGIFALYFFSEVPRVRKDIIEKIPIIGSYFHKEIPPEDNPF